MLKRYMHGLEHQFTDEVSLFNFVTHGVRGVFKMDNRHWNNQLWKMIEIVL